MPQWSNKDHNRIARILKNNKPKDYDIVNMVQELVNRQWRMLVEDFAASFESDSPFFNKEVFWKNCGYDVQDS